jgi:hypothetical protein
LSISVRNLLLRILIKDSILFSISGRMQAMLECQSQRNSWIIQCSQSAGIRIEFDEAWQEDLEEYGWLWRHSLPLYCPLSWTIDLNCALILSGLLTTYPDSLIVNCECSRIQSHLELFHLTFTFMDHFDFGFRVLFLERGSRMCYFSCVRSESKVNSHVTAFIVSFLRRYIFYFVEATLRYPSDTTRVKIFGRLLFRA